VKNGLLIGFSFSLKDLLVDKVVCLSPFASLPNFGLGFYKGWKDRKGGNCRSNALLH
jgi:predicted nucleotide-binding protein (sugar kinase/HSP70/actin superfamily)